MSEMRALKKPFLAKTVMAASIIFECLSDVLMDSAE